MRFQKQGDFIGFFSKCNHPLTLTSLISNKSVSD